MSQKWPKTHSGKFRNHLSRPKIEKQLYLVFFNFSKFCTVSEIWPIKVEIPVRAIFSLSCICSSCLIELTKTANTWTLTAVSSQSLETFSDARLPSSGVYQTIIRRHILPFLLRSSCNHQRQTLAQPGDCQVAFALPLLSMVFLSLLSSSLAVFFVAGIFSSAGRLNSSQFLFSS